MTNNNIAQNSGTCVILIRQSYEASGRIYSSSRVLCDAAPNRLEQQLTVNKPDAVWVTDESSRGRHLFKKYQINYRS